MRISVNNGLFLSSAQADDKNSRSEFKYLLTQKNHHCVTPADNKEWSEICIETDYHCDAFNIKTECNPE